MVLYEGRLPEPEEGEEPYDYLQRLGARGASRHLTRMFQTLSDFVPGLDQDKASGQYQVAYDYFGDRNNGIQGTYELLREIHLTMQEYDQQGIVMSPGEFIARLTITSPDAEQELSIAADSSSESITA